MTKQFCLLIILFTVNHSVYGMDIKLFKELRERRVEEVLTQYNNSITIATLEMSNLPDIQEFLSKSFSPATVTHLRKEQKKVYKAYTAAGILLRKNSQALREIAPSQDHLMSPRKKDNND